MARTATSVAEVVANGLCIGCGLCEAVTSGAVPMVRTPRGSLRPDPVDGFTPDQETAVLAACPGTVARPRTDETATTIDRHWGALREARYAWAGDDDVRFRAATGGVLTALGGHVLEAGDAAFVLHVGAIPGDGLHSRWVMSETPADVAANTGSRYGPTAPLAGLGAALDREEPFAIIAKPCDLGAVHAHAATDPRIDELCTTRLAMVCGGQSRLTKSLLVLDEFGVDHDDVELFRYRGRGNPGPTRIETRDGRAYEKSYLEMWEDEGTWMLESRCTICPDALGEAADIAALDVWPGGAPTGEDAGFNGIVVRTERGAALVDAAAAAGDIVLGDALDPATLDDMQPHQWRKKQRLAVRVATLTAADKPTIDASGLRIDELGTALDPAEAESEAAGTRRRIEEGRWSG